MPRAADTARPTGLLVLQVLVLGLWLVGTYVLVDQLLLFPKRPGSGPNKDFPVELSEKPTLNELAVALKKAQVSSDPERFVRTLRLLKVEDELRGGWVVLNRRLSLLEHLPRLSKNRGTSQVTLNIPEGFTRFDVATRLERFGVSKRAAFLDVTTRPKLLERLAVPADSVEGYLFPATYTFTQDSPPSVVMARMVAAFRTHTREAQKRFAELIPSARLALSFHETLVLASIVEREARVPEERPIIAGVFINRLADPNFRPHRLQADPTVAYGCLVAPSVAPSCAEFDGRRITKAMVRDPLNPYNTYRIEGLPPGPIASPGLSAINAAVAPMSHDFFYFVATGGGRHTFSKTLDAHNELIHGPH